MTTDRTDSFKSAEAFIDILNAHGVDKIYLNPGHEFIDIMSHVASARSLGGKRRSCFFVWIRR